MDAAEAKGRGMEWVKVVDLQWYTLYSNCELLHAFIIAFKCHPMSQKGTRTDEISGSIALDCTEDSAYSLSPISIIQKEECTYVYPLRSATMANVEGEYTEVENVPSKGPVMPSQKLTDMEEVETVTWTFMWPPDIQVSVIMNNGLSE
jgi:hypothetical protein